MTTPTTLREIISPLSVDEFHQICADRRFFYGTGAKERFANLLTWEHLNQILDQHRLDYPRLRLFRRGEALPPASYIDYLVDFRRNRYPRVNAQRIQRELQKGAMIHFAAVDEMSLPIRTLAEDISQILRASISANVFAGTNDSVGFATHRDGHDVLVIQVHGRKHWRIYGFTTRASGSVPRDMSEVGDPPAHPVWEGEVEEGDFLYVPKGCWHSATGEHGPTLHLTLGIRRKSGVDYLQWLLSRLSEDSLLLQDLPNPVARDVLGNYMARFSSDLLGRISIETALNFLNSFDLSASRSKFTLPDTQEEDTTDEHR